MNMHAPPGKAPASPRTLADVGLPPVMMRDLLLKTLFRQNIDRVSDLAAALCLPVAVTQELVDAARTEALVEALGALRTGAAAELRYQLTESGKARALDALAQSEYYGPMPVPMEAYAEQVERQSLRNAIITRDRLTAAMGDLILPPALIDQLGPAIGAGRSILMYGPPGNGKSSISNGIRKVLGDRIFVPRAVAYAGQVISVYDPIVHSRPVETRQDPIRLRLSASRHDERYVLCDRPTVVTGGELTLPMLDLAYSPTGRTYQAPLQMKAAGGIFIVDDLGRQAESPQAIVNRWIVPLEENRDILALQSGEKFEVPFDTMVIFSTNFHPGEIFDGAALRRIFFKIRVDGPDRDAFIAIFRAVAEKKGLAVCTSTLNYLLREKYPQIGNAFASYQPVFLIDQILSICAFEGLTPRMTPELLDRAWDNLFVREGAVAR
jgi:hypothetical protein